MLTQPCFTTNSSSTSFVCFGVICDKDMRARMESIGNMMHPKGGGIGSFVCSYSFVCHRQEDLVWVHLDEGEAIIYVRESRKEHYDGGYFYLGNKKISMETKARWIKSVQNFCKEHEIPLNHYKHDIAWIVAAEVDQHY